MIRIALLVICANIVPSVKMWTQPGPYYPLPVRRSGNLPIIPPYDEALRNYTQFDGNFGQSVFPVLPPPYDNADKSTGFKITLAVIDGLINSIASRDGENYDTVYEAEVPRLFNAALLNPRIVHDRLLCVLGDVRDTIKPFKDIRYNTDVARICERRPELCDQLIQIIINTANDNGKLLKLSELVLALGKYTIKYYNFDRYYKKFIRMPQNNDTWRAYEFLVISKDFLKPLIESGAKIRRMMRGDSCSSHKLPL